MDRQLQKQNRKNKKAVDIRNCPNTHGLISLFYQLINLSLNLRVIIPRSSQPFPTFSAVAPIPTDNLTGEFINGFLCGIGFRIFAKADIPVNIETINLVKPPLSISR